MKIVQIDDVFLCPEHVERLCRCGELIQYHDVPTDEQGIQRILDADIVIDNWYHLPAEVIGAAAKLKLICVAASGFEWIDLEAARRRHIAVCNCPGYATEAVAEHTIGLMLAAIRKIHRAATDLGRGLWNPMSEIYRGRELHNRTLGIIGYGNVGQRVGEIAAKGFGMEIIYVNQKSSHQDFKQLLRQSDIISINAPLTNITKEMLGKKEFELMKQGVVIVNTGRGAIIDELVLVENLKSGKVLAAGLDVFVDQPPTPDNQLFNLPNVVATPHIGFSTEEALHRLSETITENIEKFIEGKPQNVVS
jgi:glycerate dehydrogenase